MHSGAILTRHACTLFPRRCHDDDLVVAGEAAHELLGNRLESAEMRRIVVRHDPDHERFTICRPV